MNSQLQLRQLTSLAKVFPDFINSGSSTRGNSCVRGQEFSYQIAYRVQTEEYEVIPYRVQIDVPNGVEVQLYNVECVPGMLPYFKGIRSDDDYITQKTGMFPDVLIPVENEEISARIQYWRSLWVNVKISEDCPAGKHVLTISFSDADGNCVGRKKFCTEVYPHQLPEQKLLYAQWFHCDCIADVHGVSVFSEKHWKLIENYMQLARESGMNLIFTPILTPPVDTAVGGERPTVQLVDITYDGTEYRFDFSKLKRWIGLAKACGFYGYEINHFFTQWGAEHAPKVVATVNGKTKRIFGWDTDAGGEDYRNFLSALIPSVIEVFGEEGITKERLFFHISDEPTKPHMAAYKTASEILLPLVEGCTQFDALSEYEFYENGLVREPVAATDHIGPFLEHQVPNLWAYYCCWQGNKVGNRFFAMPSYRNRILGVQMYKANIRGFLQWGYNFYYTRLSKRVVDPYRDTCCGMEFVSGDAYSVYPYRDGATPSLRMKVFYDALQDMRLLYLAEEKIGRDAVLEALDRLCGAPLTFAEYPRTETFFRDLEDFIFSVLAENAQ